jgi:uncharacterized protein (DUF58 family)
VLPTWRLLGALALGALVYLYGATSEVAWLFLLGFLIWSSAFGMLAYAAWNRRGLAAAIRLLAVDSSDTSPVSDLPENEFRDAPLPAPVFEGDRVRLEVRISAADGRPHGPARFRAGVGGAIVEAGTGLVPAAGWSAVRELGPVLRGPLAADAARLESGDPLGFFKSRSQRPPESLALVLPRFCSLADNLRVREVESQQTVVRAGHGNDLYGVREYRAGDSLRRIHWRTSARRGQLVVREFEPPGQRVLALLLDADPGSREAADQVARLAASEAWDCLRAGGRVVAWAPGREGLGLDRSRSIWSVLDWLANWPDLPEDSAEPPRVLDAVAVTDQAAGPAVAALHGLHDHGANVRAWLVGPGELELPFERAGLEWPLPE